jgi:indolepyruvate ferredoxin oxidoreductase beta subunit
MIFNCMIAGVGGQGTVLASKLVAAAAMKLGLDVRTTETIGMAQRGGSVVSHVRMGEDIFSPLIPLGSAHALIAFEPAEAVRQLPYLSQQGMLIVCDSAVKPAAGATAGAPYEPGEVLAYIKDAVPQALIINGQPIKEQCPKALNVALLGATAASGVFPFSAATLQEVLPEMLPPQHLELNLLAFELGRKLWDEQLR